MSLDRPPESAEAVARQGGRAAATMVVAVGAPGQMGSAIGQRMARQGARVLTSLAGRSSASVERAMKAGMVDAIDADIAQADYFLSIVPPKDALATATRLHDWLARAPAKAVYLDCNAISVETTCAIADVIGPTGARYVDACIIGGPGRMEDVGPTLYLAGEEPADVAALSALGLRVRSTGGPVGAASALKMAYSGLNKGLTGLAAAMVMAATRAGAAQALHDELGYSQPQLLHHIGHTLPDMYAKAYRWDFEMQEVARFAGDGNEAAQIFEGMASLYAQLAADWQGPRAGAQAIDAFLALRAPTE